MELIGREAELAQIGDYVEGDQPQLPFRPLLIHGPGGIGKSAVIARYLLDRTHTQHRLPYAYLTFDRDDLLPQASLGLLGEALQQLGLQHPEVGAEVDMVLADLNSIELRRALTDADVVRTRGASVRAADAQDVAWTLDHIASVADQIGDGPIVLVLDTFERAQRQGQAALSRLWELLTDAVQVIPQLRVVILGRAPIPKLPVEARQLTGLTIAASVDLLHARLGHVRLDEKFLEQVAQQVRGVPLSLRLAADVMAREAKGLRSEAGRRRFLLELPDTAVQGMLYRRVLAHIDDPDVERLAVPGLVLRRLTPDVIRVVLAPACGMGTISRERAQALFTALRKETSLVDEDGDAVSHRADVRQEVLPLMDPAQVASLHRRAIKYYKSRRDIPDRTEELYHRMALDQSVRTLEARWDPEAAARLDTALDELPPRAASFLANRLGIDVDAATLQLASDRDWAQQTTRNVRAMLDDGATEAALAALQSRRTARLDYEIAALHVEALARAQRPDEALQRADAAERAATARGDARQAVRFRLLQAQLAEDLGRYDNALTLLTRARLTAQRHGDRLQELAAATSSLRVHRRQGDTDSPEVLGLRDEVLMTATTLPRRELRRSPGLLRDLAAEVGTALPWVVVEASKLIGLDVVSDDARTAHAGKGRSDSADIVREALKPRPTKQRAAGRRVRGLGGLPGAGHHGRPRWTNQQVPDRQ